jgi:hypothetical protein
VTTVVKFQPQAKFDQHPHPEGEACAVCAASSGWLFLVTRFSQARVHGSRQEIFVLDGVFSDWRGHHGPGVLLLNPEGFEHAPFSENGCLLLVRLRQYPGNRPQRATDSNAMGIVLRVLWFSVDNTTMSHACYSMGANEASRHTTQDSVQGSRIPRHIRATEVS